jgi:hypothetical protein
MDTGAYMANQMDNLIEASQHHHEDFCEKLEKDIAVFIKEKEYDFTEIDVFTEYYLQYSKGYDVKPEVGITIKKFENRLKAVYRHR